MRRGTDVHRARGFGDRITGAHSCHAPSPARWTLIATAFPIDGGEGAFWSHPHDSRPPEEHDRLATLDPFRKGGAAGARISISQGPCVAT